MDRIEEPLFTHEMPKWDFRMASGTLVYGRGGSEDRNAAPQEWHNSPDFCNVHFVSIDNQNTDSVTFSSSRADGSCARKHDVSLHDIESIGAALASMPSPIFIDITALTHRTWAPLLRTAVVHNLEVSLLYLEPDTYTRSGVMSEGEIYDLSERIDGIEPLPGFVRLGQPPGESGKFVPMIGFEGARLSHILSSIEAPHESIIPVIGVPGFRPEYSFYAYSRNRSALEENFVHRQVMYAKANCPFDAFHTLCEVHSWAPSEPLRIAPIGTKPHAVGAVLYALSRGSLVELIYDHPVRSKVRTKGAARLCIYDIGSFLQTSAFRSYSDQLNTAENLING